MSLAAKRLAPKLDVLRELYLKSGNQCAFPGCKEVMIDSDGTFVGELCHIEAARRKGPRFNKRQTNEERREFSNLMLMCHKQHKKTDDIKRFSVATLVKMKADHEAKFTDVVKAIRNSITDVTEHDDIVPCKTLQAINAKLKWGLPVQELSENVKEANALAEKLKKLPVPTRELLAIAVKRANKPSGFGRDGLEFSVSEIKHATNQDVDTLREHFQMLDKYGITREGDEDDFGQLHVQLRNLKSGWCFFGDLRRYCTKAAIPIEEVIVSLNFSVLD